MSEGRNKKDKALNSLQTEVDHEREKFWSGKGILKNSD
jgi:hypothetical protein